MTSVPNDRNSNELSDSLSTELINLCSLLPDVVPGSALPAGTPVVVIISAPTSLVVPTSPVAGVPSPTVTLPVTVRASWTVTDQNGAALVEGKDYRLTVDPAGLTSWFVFEPLATNRTITIKPTITLTAGALSVANVDMGELTYQLPALSGADLAKAITSIFRVVPPAPTTPPFGRAVASVVPTTPDPSGVITSIAVETPKVSVRGAIPLTPLAEALASPIGNIADLTGFGPEVRSAMSTVAELLFDDLALPIALDLAGQRVTNNYAANTLPCAPNLTETAQGFTGQLPVGYWPLDITAAISWALTLDARDGTKTPAPPPADGPLAAVALPIWMSDAFDDVPADLPGAQLTPTVNVSVAALAITHSVALPSVSTAQLPLPVPAVAACLHHPMVSTGGPDTTPQGIIVAPLTNSANPVNFGVALGAMRACRNALSALQGLSAAETKLVVNGQSEQLEALFELSTVLDMVLKTIDGLPATATFETTARITKGGNAPLGPNWPPEFGKGVSAFFLVSPPGAGIFAQFVGNRLPILNNVCVMPYIGKMEYFPLHNVNPHNADVADDTITKIVWL